MSKKERKKDEENNKNKDKENITMALHHERSVVVDVMKRDRNSRMVCTVWGPSGSKKKDKGKENDKGQECAIPSCEAQHLDMVPLCEADGRHMHFYGSSMSPRNM